MTPRVAAKIKAWEREGLPPEESYRVHREEILADPELIAGLLELLGELN